MALFFLGVGLGLLAGLVWHWRMFAGYDAWIVENGGRLPDEESGSHE